MGEFCRRDADGNKQEEYSGFGENSDVVHTPDRPAVFWSFFNKKEVIVLVVFFLLDYMKYAFKDGVSVNIHVHV